MNDFERGFNFAIDHAAIECVKVAERQYSTLPEDKYQHEVQIKKQVAEQCAEAVRRLRKDHHHGNR